MSLRFRHSFANDFLHSAVLFAENAKSLEVEFSQKMKFPSSSKTIGHVSSDHKSFVIASIISSAAFLETAINEFFKTIQDGITDNIDYQHDRLPLTSKKNIARFWGIRALNNAPALEKYNLALFLAQKREFDKDGGLWKDVALIINLRNELIHYTPEWLTLMGEPTDKDKQIAKKFAEPLKRKLTGPYTLNPLSGEGNPFFPDKCMSYGCAKWALDSSLKFTDEFFAKLDLKSPYR